MVAAPTSVVATRLDASRASLSWAHGGGASGFVVERRVNAEDYIWREFARLAGSARSWVDSTLIDDRVYRYRVTALGSPNSGVVESGDVATRPWAPSRVSAHRLATGDIRVEWVDAAFADERFEVEQQWDRGLQSEGTASLTSSVPGDWHVRERRVTYTFTPSGSATTRRFRVRAVNVGGVSDWSAWSGEITMGTVPPAKPTRTTPRGVTIGTLTVPLSWQHNPLDGAVQTAYEVEWALGEPGEGPEVWQTTGKVVSSTSGHSLAIPAASTVRWRVRTWGAHLDPSDWSDVSQIRHSTRPTVTILQPAVSATIGSSRLSVQWSYSAGTGGSPQSAYEVTLRDYMDESILVSDVQHGSETAWVSGPVITPGQYRLSLRVQNANGQWSLLADRVFTASYAPPPASTLTLSWVQVGGFVRLALSTPSTSPQAVEADIERSVDGTTWEPVVTGVAPTGAYEDPVPPFDSDVWYRVVTRSALPSTRVNTPVSVQTGSGGSWIYLNAGPNLATVAKIAANPTIGDTGEPDVTLKVFDGDTKATPLRGTAYLRSGTVAGDLVWVNCQIYGDASPAERFHMVAAMAGPKRLRDPRGRSLLVEITQVSATDEPRTTRVSFAWHEVAPT